MSHRKKILITRDREGNQALSRKLKCKGVRVVRWETFRCVAVPSTKKLRRALSHIDCFDWTVFTSPRAVRFTIGQIRPIRPIRPIEHIKIAAVGQATAKAVRAFGLKVALVSRVASAKGLALEPVFQKARGLKIFFPKASDAQGDFEKILGRKHRITSCVVYRKKFVKHAKSEIKKLLSQKFDLVLFYSPSAVRAMGRGLGRKDFIRLIRRMGPIGQVQVKTIGPTTAQALRECLRS